MNQLHTLPITLAKYLSSLNVEFDETEDFEGTEELLRAEIAEERKWQHVTKPKQE